MSCGAQNRTSQFGSGGVPTGADVVVLVMGVAGCGKTTVGRLLADQLRATLCGAEVRFLDADDYHPAANVAKMRAGQPLTDADREPWLMRLRTAIYAAPVATRAQGRSELFRAAGSGAGAGVGRMDQPPPPPPCGGGGDAGGRTRVTVVACSALKRAYRDSLRRPIAAMARGPRLTAAGATTSCEPLRAGQARWEPRATVAAAFFVVHLTVAPAEAVRRIQERRAHYASAGIAAGQFRDLEAPRLSLSALDLARGAELGVAFPSTKSVPPRIVARNAASRVTTWILTGATPGRGASAHMAKL